MIRGGTDLLDCRWLGPLQPTMDGLLKQLAVSGFSLSLSLSPSAVFFSNFAVFYPLRPSSKHRSPFVCTMLWAEAPQNRTASWEPPPSKRGSFQILSSCLITLGLCIWTALHLNVPEHDNGPKRSSWDPRGWIGKQQWRKVGWLVLGMLAPEMVSL
jgi:hypothetical protein